MNHALVPGTSGRYCRAGLAALVALLPLSAIAQDSPGEWLERMSGAVATTDYEGTVIRRLRNDTEVLKVVHKVIDGEVHEKLVSQEGEGLEFIRIGDEVHCILPNKKSVLVEKSDHRNSLFSALPHAEIAQTPHYDLALQGTERVAGRTAMLLAVRPHDEYRYGYRIWLERQSGLPLKTEVVGVDGDVIEQIKFADIRIGHNIAADALAPSVEIDSSYTWYREPARYRRVEPASDWAAGDPPPGFELISANSEIAEDADDSTTHLVYSDGVASVSVFIAANTGKQNAGWSNMGTSHSFTVDQGDIEITAVGEVPGVTVQRIATSIRRQ